MVIDIPSLNMPNKLCEGRVVGKQSIKSLVSTMPMRSSCILEIVHSDVCGFLKSISLVETSIFSFIDEFG